MEVLAKIPVRNLRSPRAKKFSGESGLRPSFIVIRHSREQQKTSRE